MPAGAIVHWEVTPSGLAYPTNPYAQQTTLSKSGNGLITLKATITNSCTILPIISKSDILVGTPQPGPITLLLIDPVMGKIQAQVDPVADASSYNWYKNGVLVSGASYHNNIVQIPISKTKCDIEYDISVEAINICGTSLRTHANAYVACDNYFMISPNPASGTITISPVQTQMSSSNTKTISKIKIFDNLGTLKKQQTYPQQHSAGLSVASLPSGIYFIEISGNGFKEKHQLVIQK